MHLRAARDFLLISGLSLVLGLAAATGNFAAAQSSYQEAPALKALVDAGSLPPVAERLPEEPLVQEVVEQIGSYGGTLRRGFLGPSDHNNYTRVVYDALARYSPDGSEVIPHIAKGWESNDDFTQWTVFLRPGMKWSDGAPFGADDILFWYEHIVLNTDLSPTVPVWMQNQDGSAAMVEKVDDDHGALDLRPAQHRVPLEPRQHGRRRPLDHQPRLRAGALHEAVPSGVRRPGRARRQGRRARLPDLGRAVHGRGAAAYQRPAPEHRGLGPGRHHGRRRGVRAQAQPLLFRGRRRGQPAALHRRGALQLLRRCRDPEPRRDRRPDRHAGPPHQDEQLPGPGRERGQGRLSRADLPDLRRLGRGADAEPDLQERRGDRRAAAHQGLPHRALARDRPRGDQGAGLPRHRRAAAAGAGAQPPLLSGRRARLQVHPARPRPGQRAARRHRAHRARWRRHAAPAQRRAARPRDQRRAGVRQLARHRPAGGRGLGRGRRARPHRDPRAHAALRDARFGRPDDRDLERGHRRASRSAASPSSTCAATPA